MNKISLMEKFELKLLKSDGNEFQDLFYRIMKWYYKKKDLEFIEIKPQGSIGDKGCDGYVKTKGIFYQVYGPENPNNSKTKSNTISKLLKDFNKLYENTKINFYEEIKEFYFVINNKGIRGAVTPTLDTELRELEENYPNINFFYFANNDLLNIFLKLSALEQGYILGIYTDFPQISVNNEVISKIIDYLLKNKSVFNDINNELNVSDFEEKIKFNKLNKNIYHQLINASYSILCLDEYLYTYDNERIKDDLCQIYKELYNEACEKYPEESNLQFYYIVEQSIPEVYKNNEDNKMQNIVLPMIYIIISKYFECCDIFEKPKK